MAILGIIAVIFAALMGSIAWLIATWAKEGMDEILDRDVKTHGRASQHSKRHNYKEAEKEVSSKQ